MSLSSIKLIYTRAFTRPTRNQEIKYMVFLLEEEMKF